MRNQRIAALGMVLAISLAPWAPALAAAPTAAAPATLAEDADAMDVVVLLDLSQSTLPYFQDVTDYVVSSVVRDYLRLGDTFHLLSFGEAAQAEIAQRVSGEADVKAVLGRLYLLYPLARYSDLVGALNYLHQYLSDLSESRRKVVVMITDGVHNPPPGSPTFGLDPESVSGEIEAAASRIRANGWPIRIIRLPFPKEGETGAPASGSAESKGKSYLDAAAKALGADVSDFSSAGKADIARKSLSQPIASFPGPLGKVDYLFTFPLKLENGSDSPVGLELDRVRLGDADILAKKSFLTLPGGRSGQMEVQVLIPDSAPEGPARLEVRLHFANGVRVSPETGILELSLARSPLASFLRSAAGSIALFIAILALGLGAIFALILIVRRMPKKAEAPIAAAVLEADAEKAAAAARSEKPGAGLPVPAQAPTAAASQASKAAASQTPKAAQPAALAGAASIAAARIAAARIAADEGDRTASAAASASAIVKGRREESARSAALLAQAAKAGAGSKDAAGAPAAREDGREAEVESSAAAIAAQRREESARTLALLSEAAGRRQPARLPSSADEAKARSAANAFVSRVVKPGIARIELLVEDQNPHIGLRNVHAISAGAAKSVGGGGSDFLVFLVSVPRRSAEIRFDGEKLCFVPLRPELFPELGGPVEDCLGKAIPMISRSGYPLRLRFAAYERPVDKINRLLHSIETPGL